MSPHSIKRDPQSTDGDVVTERHPDGTHTWTTPLADTITAPVCTCVCVCVYAGLLTHTLRMN